ncbi:MAG TPA: porin [Geothrix sp.]|nr:porin [Geothrix sp.]
MKSFLTPLALVLLALPMAAQSPETDKRVAELERKLDILSRELESQKTGTASPAAKEEGTLGLAPAASKVYETKGGLSIGGYGELTYENYGQTLENGQRDPKAPVADTLRLILYTGYKFTDSIVFNSELEFEHGGYSDEHVEGEVKVEFAYFDFLVNKAFNVRAGKVLMPLGFINEIHEPPTFLSVKRPFTEKYIIPTTWTEMGVGAHGEFGAGFSYRTYVSTGLQATNRGDGLTEGFTSEGIEGGRQDGKEAFARSLAFSGRLDWSPIPGITFGVGHYTGNSGTNTETGEGVAIRTKVTEFHGEYKANGLQVRALYAAFTNDRAGVEALAAGDPAREVGLKADGGYVEAGYDLFNGRFGKKALIPFLRLEKFNTQKEVAEGTVANPENDRRITTVGIAYKPIPQVAIKADFMKAENQAKTGRNQFNLALGYYF